MSRRSGRGYDDGFDAFAASTTGDLLRTASLIVWDPSIAEDVVQECLLQVVRRWSRVRRMAYPAAYARRIATNLAIAAAERLSTERAELAAGLAFEPVDAAARLDLEQVDHQRDLDAARTGSHRASGRYWCFDSSRTSPRPRPPTCSAARSAR